MAAALQESLLQENPLFNDLLSTLKQKLDKDGTPFEKKQILREMREELKVTRRNYLQQKVLYQALTSVTKAKLCQGDSDGRTKRLFQLLQRSTAVADSTQSLSLTPSQNILGVLGRHLEQADVLYGSDRKDDVIQRVVVPEMRKVMWSLIEQLLHFREHGGHASSKPDLLRARAANLACVVREEATALKEQRAELAELSLVKKTRTDELFQMLTDNLSLLKELLEDYRLNQKAMYNRETYQWLRAKRQALELKIDVMSNQVLIDTYTKENVAALSCVRRELVRMDRSLDQQILSTTAMLQSYQAVGKEFTDIASQYAQVAMEIENKKWAARVSQRQVK